MSYIFKECEAKGKPTKKIVELFDYIKNFDKDIRDFLESRNGGEYIDYKLFKIDAIHYCPESWEFCDFSEVEKDFDIFKIAMVIEITIKEGEKYDLVLFCATTKHNFMKKIHPIERFTHYLRDSSFCFGIIPKHDGDNTLKIAGCFNLAHPIENSDHSKFFDHYMEFYLGELIDRVTQTDEQNQLRIDYVTKLDEEWKAKNEKD